MTHLAANRIVGFKPFRLGTRHVAVIVDMPDGELSRQRRDVSAVIDIEMRDEQVVDAPQTGRLESFQNSIGRCRPGI